MIGAGLLLIAVTAYQWTAWQQTGVWPPAPISALLPLAGIDLGSAPRIQALVEPVLKLSAAFAALFVGALVFWFREELRLARSRHPQALPVRRATRPKTRQTAFWRSSSGVRAALILVSCLVFALTVAVSGKVTATSDDGCCAPHNPIINTDVAQRVG